MTNQAGYRVTPGAALAELRELADLLRRVDAVVTGVRGLAAPTGSYGRFGAAVSAANADLQVQQVAALAELVRTLGELHRRIGTSVRDYERADRAVTDDLRAVAPDPIGRWRSRP